MENEERGFDWKGFLLKALLVILFVFLLMWFFPLPKMEPINDTLFNENLKNMKEVAKTYYTVERLPKNVGDKVKMTLQEMIDQNMILPIIDSQGKACDTKASYVEITKTDSEYLIKTNLSCPSKTAYVIEHYGCYDICSDKCNTTTATKTATKTVTKTTKIIKKVTPTPEKEYLYVYRKDTTVTKEKWSDWSADIKYTSSDNIKFGCTSTKCIEVSPNSPKYEYAGSKTIYKKDSSGNYVSIYKTSLTNYIGSYYISACVGYNYTIYQNYGTYSTVTGTNWVYQGTYSYKNAPSDTPTEKYEYVGAGFASDCTGTCSSDYLLFKKYTLNTTRVTTSTSATNIVITCGNVATQEVKVYGAKTDFVGYVVDKRVDIYNTITYYRYKTKETYTESSYDIQERSKPDQSLIDNGYRLIETRIVK